jgi:hypothetical protein
MSRVYIGSFFKKAPVNSMKITYENNTDQLTIEPVSPPKMDSKISEILQVHNALWNRELSIQFNGNTYKPHVPEHGGFSSLILPNENQYNFLWLTQNLNKTSTTTSKILHSRSQGDDLRITWIVDNNGGKFTYVGCVTTIDYFDGNTSKIIERYTDEGTFVVYSSDPTKGLSRSRF